MKKLILPLLIILFAVACDAPVAKQNNTPAPAAKASKNAKSITVAPLNDTLALGLTLGESKSEALAHISQLISQGKIKAKAPFVGGYGEMDGYGYQLFYGTGNCTTYVTTEFKNNKLTRLFFWGSVANESEMLHVLSFFGNKYGQPDETKDDQTFWYDGYKKTTFNKISNYLFYLAFVDEREIAKEAEENKKEDDKAQAEEKAKEEKAKKDF